MRTSATSVLPGDLAVLRPCHGTSDPSRLTEHMDACVAAAVRLGLTSGAALALYGTVMERFGPDLTRADQELVSGLSQLLGLTP